MTWRCLREFLKERNISYPQYLQTDHWKDVRRRFWASKLHNRTCYVCGGREQLQVHHKTYRSIGRENLNHLCLLCDRCHKATHELDRKRKKGCLFGAAKRLRKDYAKGPTR